MQLKVCNIQGPVASIFGSVNTGSWRIERPVVNYSKCSTCGICERYCPVDAITIDKNIRECVQIMFEYCKGCGICANECPRKCIEMVTEGTEI